MAQMLRLGNLSINLDRITQVDELKKDGLSIRFGHPSETIVVKIGHGTSQELLDFVAYVRNWVIANEVK